jgi:hypothetical protein
MGIDITDSLKQIVGTVAPLIANALLPGSGGLAASLLAQVLGTSTDPQALLTAAQGMTPEQAVGLKKLELEHALELAKISANLDLANLQDIQNARSRDTAIQTTGHGNSRANWMIAGDVIGLVVCLFMLIYLPDAAPGEVRGMLATFGSYFGLGLRDAHQFEFGSSRGSREKSELLAQAPSIEGK